MPIDSLVEVNSGSGNSGIPHARRARVLGCLLLVACAVLGTNAGAARADFLSFRFDDGRVNIGQYKGERLVDPAAGTPIATLYGSIDPASGEWTAPATGLSIPPKTLTNVATGVMPVDVIVDFSGAGTFAGNFDVATGVLETRTADVTALISVYPAGSAGNSSQLLASCRVTPVPVLLSTTGELVNDSDPLNPVTYSAAPFTQHGAGVATWAGFPAATPAGGSMAALVCPMVDQLAAGPGGLWLSGIGKVSATDSSSPPPGSISPTAVPAQTSSPSAKRCKRGQKLKRDRCVKKHRPAR